MTTLSQTYPLYDLTNAHFQQLEIITKKSGTQKGQFVKFKVVKGAIEYIYPSEKFCFLPEQNKKEFWNSYNSNKGEFTNVPDYIQQLSLADISKIIVEPALALEN